MEQIPSEESIFEMQILTKNVIKSPLEHVYNGKKNNNEVKTPDIKKKNSVIRSKCRPRQLYLKCKF